MENMIYVCEMEGQKKTGVNGCMGVWIGLSMMPVCIGCDYRFLAPRQKPESMDRLRVWMGPSMKDSPVRAW